MLRELTFEGLHKKVRVKIPRNNSYLTQWFAPLFEDGYGIGEPLVMALIAKGWLKVDKEKKEVCIDKKGGT